MASLKSSSVCWRDGLLLRLGLSAGLQHIYGKDMAKALHVLCRPLRMVLADEKCTWW